MICSHANYGTLIGPDVDDGYYLCSENPSSSTSSWEKIDVDEECEKEGNSENLTYGGTLLDPNSSSSVDHCGSSSMIPCQTEDYMRICHVGNYSFIDLGDGKWSSPQEYCSENSIGGACEFPQNDYGTPKYFEQTEFYVKDGSDKWVKATDSEEYCNAQEASSCYFNFTYYTKCSGDWVNGYMLFCDND